MREKEELYGADMAHKIAVKKWVRKTQRKVTKCACEGLFVAEMEMFGENKYREEQLVENLRKDGFRVEIKTLQTHKLFEIRW